jgi:hypothetical protein
MKNTAGEERHVAELTSFYPTCIALSTRDEGCDSQKEAIEELLALIPVPARLS